MHINMTYYPPLCMHWFISTYISFVYLIYLIPKHVHIIFFDHIICDILILYT